MKLCVQRVKKASVSIDNQIYSSIGKGLLVLACIENTDCVEKLDWMADKLVNLRIFEDNQGKMSLSLLDIAGEILVVSQFTLAGDCSKGRRPDFSKSAKPDVAKEYYELFIDKIEKKISNKVSTGIFGADMEINLINEGPVTILMEK